MVAAIKAAHVEPLKVTECCCDLISQFLKGACRVVLYHRRPALLTWDLEVVLLALQNSCLQSCRLKEESSMAFQCRKGAARLLPGGARVLLHPNPAFHSILLPKSHTSQLIELRPFHPFHPPQDSEAGLSRKSLLYPVRALTVYLQPTDAD